MTTLLNAPTEELVRSRYAVRVGDIDVLVISDGERRVVRGYPPAVSVRGAGGGWGCVSLGGGLVGFTLLAEHAVLHLVHAASQACGAVVQLLGAGVRRPR